MKRQFLIPLALMLALAALISGCNPAAPSATATPPVETTAPPQTTPPATPAATPEATPGQSGLNGDTKDILASINEGANIDFSTFDEQITAETCQSYLGLTAEQLDEYVEDAYVSVAEMNVSAHLSALVKCNDEASAEQVKQLIADGFDSGRWVCVRPDQSFVVDAGIYVFLVASYDETATALKDSFLAISGDAAGEVDVFFEAE